jgi:hypothetical protein
MFETVRREEKPRKKALKQKNQPKLCNLADG